MTNIVELPKQSLAITVWDHSKGTQQNDYIGNNIRKQPTYNEQFLWAALYF